MFVRGGSPINPDCDPLLADAESILSTYMIEGILNDEGQQPDKFAIYEYLDIDSAKLVTNFPDEVVNTGDTYSMFEIPLCPRYVAPD